MSRKIKLAIIAQHFEGGGAEKILYRIITNFKDRFDISLITLYDKGIYLEELKQQNIQYYSIHAEKGNTLTFSFRIRKILNKVKPHAVLSFLYYQNIITYLALSKKGAAFFPSERSNHRKYLSTSFKHKIWKILLSGAYKRATTVISISEKCKQAIHEDFSVPLSKIKTIYNGISFIQLDKLKIESIYDFSFSVKKKYIIAVGSLNTVKNYPLLIEAFEKVYLKYFEIELVILGKGDQEEYLRKIIAQKKLTSSIHLMGFKKNPYKYIARATCYVLSSNYEGFPNALVEGMYVNGHVISTNCLTGPDEIISHMEDGILCPVGDRDSLANAIESICFNVTLREKLYLNSRRKILNFDEKIMIEQYQDLIETSLKENVR